MYTVCFIRTMKPVVFIQKLNNFWILLINSFWISFSLCKQEIFLPLVAITNKPGLLSIFLFKFASIQLFLTCIHSKPGVQWISFNRPIKVSFHTVWTFRSQCYDFLCVKLIHILANVSKFQYAQPEKYCPPVAWPDPKAKFTRLLCLDYLKSISSLNIFYKISPTTP